MGINNKVVRFFLLFSFVGVITFLVPYVIGLGAQVFDASEFLSKYNFYLSGGLFALFLVGFYIAELIIKKGDSNYGSSILFSDPGEWPAVSFFKRFSNLQLFLLSLAAFSVVFMFITLTFNPQTSFTGIAQIQQQASEFSQTLFSNTLVPGAENLGLALAIAAFLVSLRILARKNKLDKNSFRSYAIFGSVAVGAIYWLVNHFLRYSGQDYALLSVLAFGLIMSLLVVFSGSFVVGWALHIINNTFFELRRLFGSDTAIVYTGAIVFLLVAIYVGIYNKKLFGSKKVENTL